MGAFLAADLAARHPGMLEDVTLVSARPKYDRDSIAGIKKLVKKNRAGYLYKFYGDCFSAGEKEMWLRFKKGLFRTYMEEMGMELLLDGLDYLSGAELKAGSLNGLNTTFIHGSLDKIAPIGEILTFKEKLSGAKFIRIDGAGHMPFFAQSPWIKI